MKRERRRARTNAAGAHPMRIRRRLGNCWMGLNE
ncbi:hypothetical protein SAMN05414139_08331 [Burkholderia sp. D7]|nr:hypothetical protein SAMN05414139_08331 [Burkholderia sp. D7]